jgi:hypothetical protein
MPKSTTGTVAVPKALALAAENGESCSVRTIAPSISAL